MIFYVAISISEIDILAFICIWIYMGLHKIKLYWKYNNPENALPKICKGVKNYFEENKIFTEETIFKINRRNTDFLSIFSKKTTRVNKEIIQNKRNQDKEFIEKYITDLFLNKSPDNKVIEEKKGNEKNITVENKEIINNIKENNKTINNNEEQIQKKNIQLLNKDNNEDNIDQINSEEKKEVNKKKSDTLEKNEIKKEEKNILDNINQKENVDNTIKSEIINKSQSAETSKEKEENEYQDWFKDVIQKYFYTENNPNFLTNAETFIKKLSYLRSKGYFLIGDKLYNAILSLFFIILNKEQFNYYILKNVLILSQTFYKIKDNKKVYLQQGLKGMKIFAIPETWHRVINYSMNLSCSSMDLTQTKEDMIKKINKEANVIIMAYLCDIKQYTDKERVFNEVKNYYVKVYNMDEKMVDKEVKNYMDSLDKNESSEQEKHIKIEEIIKNDDDLDVDNNEINGNNDETVNFFNKRSNSTPLNIKNNNNNISKDKKAIEIKSITENIKEENESEENNTTNEINDDNIKKEKNNLEVVNNEKAENSENKNQIINNNINIIKIEAKEVIIVENNSKNNINIEQIKELKKEKENIDITKDDNVKKEDDKIDEIQNKEDKKE